MTTHGSLMECIAKSWHRLLEAKRFAASFSKLFRSHRSVMTECDTDVGKIKARIFSGLLSRRLEACQHELSQDPAKNGGIVPLPGIKNHNKPSLYERTK